MIGGTVDRSTYRDWRVLSGGFRPPPARREHLPPGPFRTSEALDAAFTEGDWWASAYLDPRAGQLVLTATGAQ